MIKPFVVYGTILTPTLMLIRQPFLFFDAMLLLIREHITKTVCSDRRTDRNKYYLA